MTLKAIAEKYDIPYSVVVKASAHVFPVQTRERMNDYPEKEVRKHLLQYLSAERNKYRVKSDDCDRMIRNMIERG